MTKFVIPVFLIAVSIGLYLGYIRPALAENELLKQEQARLDQALDRSRELQEVRDALNERRKNFARTDIERLGKMLPDHIDNVRLVIDVDNIAAAYGLQIRDFDFSDSDEENSGTGGQIAAPATLYGAVNMNFAVTATYQEFLSFMRDLERSLRLVDVTGFSLTSDPSGVYEFNVQIRTYWLR